MNRPKNGYLEDREGMVSCAASPTPASTHAEIDDHHASFRLIISLHPNTTPPSAKLTTRSVRVGLPLRVRVRDAGAGVDPASLEATIDGRSVTARLVGDEVRIQTIGFAPGTRRLRLSVADYQETRNMENVARILPNTRVVNASVTVRRR